MDIRDKQLDEHMKKRMLLAADLPSEKQREWANKCIDMAMTQHRIAFYFKCKMWLWMI